MQNFGEFLPEHLRNQFAGSNLKIGAVLLLPASYTKPPKEKRMIVVGMDDEEVTLLLFLLIQKSIPKFFPPQPYVLYIWNWIMLVGHTSTIFRMWIVRDCIRTLLPMC